MAAVRGIEEHIRDPGPVRIRPPSKATLGKGQGPITPALIVWLRVEDPSRPNESAFQRKCPSAGSRGTPKRREREAALGDLKGEGRTIERGGSGGG